MTILHQLPQLCGQKYKTGFSSLREKDAKQMRYNVDAPQGRRRRSRQAAAREACCKPCEEPLFIARLSFIAAFTTEPFILKINGEIRSCIQTNF